mmetsp:Transcript_11125/g.28203  ORF Transcript_11125/g.28203 Transcript_11125/m.28203 type:complete len:265 (-) Transcript_11125:328-1122(-)
MLKPSCRQTHKAQTSEGPQLNPRIGCACFVPFCLHAPEIEHNDKQGRNRQQHHGQPAEAGDEVHQSAPTPPGSNSTQTRPNRHGSGCHQRLQEKLEPMLGHLRQHGRQPIRILESHFRNGVRGAQRKPEITCGREQGPGGPDDEPCDIASTLSHRSNFHAHRHNEIHSVSKQIHDTPRRHMLLEIGIQKASGALTEIYYADDQHQVRHPRKYDPQGARHGKQRLGQEGRDFAVATMARGDYQRHQCQCVHHHSATGDSNHANHR